MNHISNVFLPIIIMTPIMFMLLMSMFNSYKKMNINKNLFKKNNNKKMTMKW
uniref:ATP synthase F0 subunit 8 n=1 Tax=Austropallene halanychi TaxID=3135633 RepID=UPI0030FF290E